jgi:hypothetical protein
VTTEIGKEPTSPWLCGRCRHDIRGDEARALFTVIHEGDPAAAHLTFVPLCTDCGAAFSLWLARKDSR